MESGQTIKWWASKGIWGSLVAGATVVWQLFNGVVTFFDANPELVKGVGTFLQALASEPANLVILTGAFFAWLGRFQATKEISNSPL